VRELSRGSYNWLRLKGFTGRNKITLRTVGLSIAFFFLPAAYCAHRQFEPFYSKESTSYKDLEQ